MIMKEFKKLFYIIPLGLIVSCAPEFDEAPSFDAGQANFSTYVAVGNSLTAGFQSGALKKEGQLNSFPAILAQQFQEVGGGAFTQPLLADGPGIGSTGNAELELGYSTDCKGASNLGPVPSAPAGQLDQFDFTDPTKFLGGNGPYGNMGIPGAKSIHLIAPGYGNPSGLLSNPRTANPFYTRFVNPANFNETVAEACVRANPTFFTLWIGANDVLGYSLGGGDESSDAITPVSSFQFAYRSIVDSLTKNNAQGVVANIPNITSLPYFNAIAWDGLELDATNAGLLNAGYAAFNAGIDQLVANSLMSQEDADLRKISFKEGDNAWVIEDKTLNDYGGMLPKMRQIRALEHLILPTPQDSLKCGGWGSQKPIPDAFVLTGNEVTNIVSATDAYNQIIKQTADAKGLGFVDANKILSEMESGLTYNGVTYSTSFVTGGTFSLDGFHPSTRGYAIIANEFINVINAKYGANLKKVDPNSYPGIIFP